MITCIDCRRTLKGPQNARDGHTSGCPVWRLEQAVMLAALDEARRKDA